MKLYGTEIIKYKVNDKIIQFVGQVYETSNSWGHIVEMVINNYEYQQHKIRYYNRTWECFRFQTAMLGCIRNEKQEIIDRAINNYKYENNITRLTKEKKDKILEDLGANNENYKAICELENIVKNGKRGNYIEE